VSPPIKLPARRARRAYLAQRRREERQEAAHACRVHASARQAGVDPGQELSVGVLFFHDLHRVLGEPSCPKCPECLALKRDGRIEANRPDRAEVLAYWERVIARHKERTHGC